MSIDNALCAVYTLIMKLLGIKKSDFIIIAAVLCAAALAFLCLNLFAAGGSVAVVEQNGAVVAELPLNENATFEVKNGGKVTNVVEVKNGEVSVTSADCPDKICQKHRPVSKSGESIVCLPNRVVITVSGSDGEVDGVAR
ncbi:MAG: NusG domain II-containing protein [Eubacterium sp.]|nr:NusG domain II-containing protein [Eubacterium sp.]